MTQIIKPSFKIIGISVKTCNRTTAGKDISALWHRFFDENIMQKIPQALSSDIYSLYSDYEGDFLDPYVATLGCLVDMNTPAPEGLVEKIIPEQTYEVFTAKGKMPDAVLQTWQQIWNSSVNRAYQADFDIYGEKSQDPEHSEVEIFVGLK